MPRLKTQGWLVGFPEPAFAKVELPGLGLAPLAIFLVHLGVACPEGLGDPRPHRTLAVAAVGERLGIMVVVEEIAGDKLGSAWLIVNPNKTVLASKHSDDEKRIERALK